MGLLYAAGAWVALGSLVWLAFATYGGPRSVPGVKGSSPLFRLMILPGVALLWPLVLVRWLHWSRATGPR